MTIGSLKDLYFDELGRLYDAETQMIRTVLRLAEAARAPELRETLTRHCDESRLHLERLELIFTHWSQRRRVKPCTGLAGIVQEADNRLNQEATVDVRDAAIIGAAQRIEHYEIAAYGCARTYARRLNRPDEARLLQETLDEEGRADRKLTDIAEAQINDDTRMEADLMDGPRPTGGLRYLAASDAAKGPGAWDRLALRNDADESLGAFDGLVVNTVSRRPRYVVVDAGGLFAHHRYLLPFEAIRFDESAQALRVDLERDIASNYPPFDRDAFKAMTDAERREYESRLFAFFPRERTASSFGAAQSQTAPEWMIEDAWVTMAHERNARPFAPEKVPTPPHGDKVG
jgi:ferritin-like metal-binding protein YciE